MREPKRQRGELCKKNKKKKRASDEAERMEKTGEGNGNEAQGKVPLWGATKNGPHQKLRGAGIGVEGDQLRGENLLG